MSEVRRIRTDLSNLNEQQRLAVLSPLKPILVVAGAGTGKTTVLTKRFEYLVRDCNIDPRNILVITFTKKAATEMKRRIEKLFPDFNFKDSYISTFHKFAKTILEKSGQDFSICFPKRAQYYIRHIISEELKLPIKAFHRTAEIVRKLKWAKQGKKITKEDLIEVVSEMARLSEEEILNKFPLEWIQNILDSYENLLKGRNQLDFDDILLKADSLLENEFIRVEWDLQFQAILFDEFQDIDEVQFEVLKKLSRDSQNIFCVGDPDQSIYGFRGAVKESFERFKSHFPDTEVFKLEWNYRSTPQILEVANTLINKDKGEFSKNLITNNPEGSKVRYFLTNSPSREDDHVIDIILNLQKESNVQLRNCAILFRNNVFGNQITNKLLAKKIPFISKDLYEFWRREEIKDMIAYLSIAFEKDLIKVDKAIQRVINKPNRGIGLKRQEELRKSAKENGISLRETIQRASDTSVVEFWNLLKKIRLFAKNEEFNVIEQVQGILNFSGFWEYLKGKDMEKHDRAKAILNNVLDESRCDLEMIKRNIEEMTRYGVEKDQLYVGTIHGAKGLEFDHVFVMKVDEGKLPSRHSINPIKAEEKESRMKEERRLAYVAFTRAKQCLYLSSSGGKENVSSFAKDVMDLVEYEEEILDLNEPESISPATDLTKDDNSENWTQPDLFFEFDNSLEEDDPFGDVVEGEED
ncbi:ATP-dependent DNA helicase UvrD/PcrA [Mycoplasma haemofelis str. Langford 1]|uniref:DNA 3'-5' helicase n=2 Tax=Mycoplasma haemofelis TaxID=29501 RepID=F6FII1_MYCHI|nr:ATP-dependent helicase [Mycoplasma haemofelis]AEG73029.1 ATP-dependent DNA helicase UvrD/PcrA [Mycoplasma haemofelis Ohio2]CBY92695.1 ATP-dependent DNA helicase UvrD/PcrA [Mycoplasma haemofelis str. Langford 1]